MSCRHGGNLDRCRACLSDSRQVLRDKCAALEKKLALVNDHELTLKISKEHQRMRLLLSSLLNTLGYSKRHIADPGLPAHIATEYNRVAKALNEITYYGDGGSWISCP